MSIYLVGDGFGDLDSSLAENEISTTFNLDLSDAKVFGFTDDVFEFNPGVYSIFTTPQFFETNVDGDEFFFKVAKNHWSPYSDFASNIMKYDLGKIIYGHGGASLPEPYSYLEPTLKQVAAQIKATHRGFPRAPKKGSCPFGCVCQYDTADLKGMLSSWPYLRSLSTKYEMCAALRFIHSDNRFPARISYPYKNKPAIIGILNHEPSYEAQQLAQKTKVQDEIMKFDQTKLKHVSKEKAPVEVPHQAESLGQAPLSTTEYYTPAQKQRMEQSLAKEQALRDHIQAAAKKSNTPVPYSPPQPESDPSPLVFGRRRRRRHYMRY